MLLLGGSTVVTALTGVNIYAATFSHTSRLTTTQVIYGRMNLDTTRRNAPMLAGNLVSILIGSAAELRSRRGRVPNRSRWLIRTEPRDGSSNGGSGSLCSNCSRRAIQQILHF
ncbi:hypothetical protein ABFS82_01G051900 [Erythranthe guttata]